MKPQSLNPYQRSSVAITLRMLEMALRDAMTELDTAADGILYRQTNPLSDLQRQQIKRLCQKAFAIIQTMKEAFALPVEIQDVRSKLQGHLAVLWSDLEDIRSDKLRRYGDVAPDLERTLDPSIAELIQTVNQIMGSL